MLHNMCDIKNAVIRDFKQWEISVIYRLLQGGLQGIIYPRGLKHNAYNSSNLFTSLELISKFSISREIIYSPLYCRVESDPGEQTKEHYNQ